MDPVLQQETLEKIKRESIAIRKEFVEIVKNNNIKIIGIHGFARVGKDSTAQFIIQHIFEDKKCFVLAYAKPLKYALHNTLLAQFRNLFSKELSEQILEELQGEYIKPLRELYQVYGTEIIRNKVYFDFWIDSLLSEIIRHQKEGKNINVYIVPDVRFNNEAETLKSVDATIVNVTRDERGVDESNPIYSHASEKEISKSFIDVVISNDGTLEDLENTIKGLKDQLR